MNDRQGRRPGLSPRRNHGPVRSVALLLPGGFGNSHGRPLGIAEWALRPLHRRLTAAGAAEGVAVHVLRYRYRGWNGAEASTLADAEWALGELRRRYGAVPVCLVGNSLGGRAAFRAAGHPGVAGVAGVAPWLPAGEPVEQLAGRWVLIVHGTRDRTEAGAAESLAYTERARAASPDVCRFEVAGANHYLLPRTTAFWSVTTEFVMATLTGGEFVPLIAQALASPDGLRVPVPAGYGRKP